ncbi:MAG TPA: DEAD/DEAH box helicase [Spongiibacteraceae bacterium]|nr:DEAD/DEAH box helicase [Spongiibacteraceae bacterium]
MSEATDFSSLGLPESLLNTLTTLGYQKPSPIQAQVIPAFLAGRDLIGQAQTGTGKTAAFALPILAGIDNALPKPQALVLAPTRELAMQVAESFQRYSANLSRCRVLAVYGGQSMRDQLQELKRGVQIVVGTPGRLLDHLNRKSLDLSALRWLVMDEADEMLRMGFIDDVEAILAHTGGTQQTALFSATMPPRIKNIADRYLREPERILIPAATTTVSNIEQHVVWARQRDKPLAVARLLAAEDFDATIIFTRTRESTTELAEQLVECGYPAQAINGDMNQSQREQTISLLKAGKIDILVATDVAARGLDVERISLVINYDMPHEFDTYVHRIGRTGRAGRSGKAILLADPRDRRSVKMLEQSTRQPLQTLELPTDAEIKQRRSNRFRQTLAEKLGHADMTSWQPLLEELRNELGQSVEELATGLLALLAEQQGLNAKLPPAPAAVSFERSNERSSGERNSRERSGAGAERGPRTERPPRRERTESTIPMDSYRMGVGRAQQIKVSDIVGAIANEAGINSSNIGRIQLFDDYSIVDLPQGMPKDVLQQLKSVRVRGHMMNLSRAGASENGANPNESAAPTGSAPAPRVRRERSKTAEIGAAREARGDKSAPRKKIALKA